MAGTKFRRRSSVARYLLQDIAMTHSDVSDRLPPGDALWLYLEKKEMPLHIGSVFNFDGPISIEELTALIEAKLPLIPRYRQRVVFPPLHAGHPTWEFDPDFDIHNHIHHAQLKRGTLAELEALAGKIYSKIMRRDRPLWDLTVVDGLEGGRSALIARVHHCLVDGIAGVSLMNLIMDHSPEPAPRPRQRPSHSLPAPESGTSLLDAVISSYSHAAGRLFSLQSAALDVTQELLGELVQGSLGQPVEAVTEIGKPMRDFPFKARCLGP